jgi:hypothetical protein
MLHLGHVVAPQRLDKRVGKIAWHSHICKHLKYQHWLVSLV